MIYWLIRMGKGGDASLLYRSSAKAAHRVPVDKPQFTVGTLRKAIPAHCFERSLLRSSSYLAADLLAIAALYFASTCMVFFGPHTGSSKGPLGLGCGSLHTSAVIRPSANGRR